MCAPGLVQQLPFDGVYIIDPVGLRVGWSLARSLAVDSYRAPIYNT